MALTANSGHYPAGDEPDEQAFVEQWRQKRAEGWTTKAIAEHWGVAQDTVRRRLGKTGRRRIKDDDVAQWRQKMLEGWTLKDIAAEWSVSVSTIHRYLGAVGLRTRNYHPLTIDDAVAAYRQYGTQQAAAEALGVGISVLRMRLYESGLGLSAYLPIRAVGRPRNPVCPTRPVACVEMKQVRSREQTRATSASHVGLRRSRSGRTAPADVPPVPQGSRTRGVSLREIAGTAGYDHRRWRPGPTAGLRHTRLENRACLTTSRPSWRRSASTPRIYPHRRPTSGHP